MYILSLVALFRDPDFPRRLALRLDGPEAGSLTARLVPQWLQDFDAHRRAMHRRIYRSGSVPALVKVKLTEVRLTDKETGVDLTEAVEQELATFEPPVTEMMEVVELLRVVEGAVLKAVLTDILARLSTAGFESMPIDPADLADCYGFSSLR